MGRIDFSRAPVSPLDRCPWDGTLADSVREAGFGRGEGPRVGCVGKERDAAAAAALERTCADLYRALPNGAEQSGQSGVFPDDWKNCIKSSEKGGA